MSVGEGPDLAFSVHPPCAPWLSGESPAPGEFTTETRSNRDRTGLRLFRQIPERFVNRILCWPRIADCCRELGVFRRQRRNLMMKNLGKLFMALCLLTVGGGIVANAQIDSDVTIRASVPFAFMVGDTTLPAGKYEIKVLDEDSLNVLELRSVNGRTSVVFDTENVETRGDQMVNKGELVFDKIGDKYFLSQVWMAGSDTGSELVKSRMERRLEGRGMKSERHSIVAILRKL